MSGLCEHIDHLCDDLNLSFWKLKRILSNLITNSIPIYEKIDGTNIYFSIKNKQILYARNKKDILSGGRDLFFLESYNFKTPQIKDIYLESLKNIESFFTENFSNEILNKIFKNGTVFYNTEISGPIFTNIINYDDNCITIHCHSHKKIKNNNIYEYNNISVNNFLKKQLNEINQEKNNFFIEINSPIKLTCDKNDYLIAKEKINKLLLKNNLTNANTIQDFIKANSKKYIKNKFPNLDEEIENSIVENLINKKNKLSLSGISRDSMYKIFEIKKEYKKIYNNSLYPLEEIIHDFSVNVLKNAKSNYVANHNEEIKRIKTNLSKALKDLSNNKNKNIQQINRNLKKIKNYKNINSTIEGIVFEHNKKLYKLTGNFAPINQIFHLYKNKNNNIIEEKEKYINNENEKTIAIFCGAFKPPHKGHYEVAKNLADNENISSVYIIISPKERYGHSANNRIKIDKKISLKIWNQYIRDNQKIKCVISSDRSPVKYLYKFCKKLHPETNVLLIQGEKENDRFNKINIPSINLKILNVPIMGNGISATKIRNLISQNNKNEFINYIPDILSEKDKKKIWHMILKNQNTLTEEINILIRETIKDYIPGGLADNQPEEKYNKEQLQKGIKVELEHTKNPKIAKEIAKDHLEEDPFYYDKLEKMEKSFKKLNEISKYPLRNIITNMTREEFYQELKLRENISSKIKNYILEEKKLRTFIKKLILEKVEDKTLHSSTGINILEDLLKKIIPILERDYKTLTTDDDQRKSFRTHIINAVQNSILVDKVTDESDKEKLKYLQINEKVDITIGDEKKDNKFIDINKKQTDPKNDEIENFTISGEDTTGRNIALQSFDKVNQQIIDAYNILDNEEDKNIFYDYLITNLKLYMDKWEEELQISISEPTTDAYEQEKEKNNIIK